MIDSKFPSEERGDALVFLSGITEITTVAEAVKVYAEQSKRWIILMLHRSPQSSPHSMRDLHRVRE
jgi:HrpA-like RNA helicase